MSFPEIYELFLKSHFLKYIKKLFLIKYNKVSNHRATKFFLNFFELGLKSGLGSDIFNYFFVLLIFVLRATITRRSPYLEQQCQSSHLGQLQNRKKTTEQLQNKIPLSLDSFNAFDHKILFNTV